jgi:hypothetical protein
VPLIPIGPFARVTSKTRVWGSLEQVIPRLSGENEMRHPTDDDLRALHDEYVWLVNAAVERGDTALAEQLADEYADEALRRLTSAAPAA